MNRSLVPIVLTVRKFDRVQQLIVHLVRNCRLYLVQSARKNALQVIADYEGTPTEAIEVPDLSALRQLYSEKNPAVPTLRLFNERYNMPYLDSRDVDGDKSFSLRTDAKPKDIVR